MSDPDRLHHELSLQESFRPGPYLDTRRLWTFAKGRCLETHPLTGPEWKRLLDNGWLQVLITVNGADWMLECESADVEAHLARTFIWWPKLNDARQNALIEMGYQMGFEKLMGFKEMLKAIAAEDWEMAYAEALNSDWGRQTPERALAVATQLKTGVFA